MGCPLGWRALGVLLTLISLFNGARRSGVHGGGCSKYDKACPGIVVTEVASGIGESTDPNAPNAPSAFVSGRSRARALTRRDGNPAVSVETANPGGVPVLGSGMVAYPVVPAPSVDDWTAGSAGRRTTLMVPTAPCPKGDVSRGCGSAVVGGDIVTGVDGLAGTGTGGDCVGRVSNVTGPDAAKDAAIDDEPGGGGGGCGCCPDGRTMGPLPPSDGRLSLRPGACNTTVGGGGSIDGGGDKRKMPEPKAGGTSVVAAGATRDPRRPAGGASLMNDDCIRVCTGDGSETDPRGVTVDFCSCCRSCCIWFCCIC